MKNKIITLLIISSLFIPIKTQALTKDETIYSVLNKNGSLYKTTIVNHLYNSNTDTIEDTTKLKEILNINGEETFTINGENLKWNNNKNEIFYKGKIEQELPIKTEVKYYLNEKELLPNEMIGKSGKVKISINLTNTDKHITNINGTNETIYTPFIVTSGMMLSTKDNSNIEITNGRVVTTGNKSILVSIATPGLYESLNLEEFKNMNNITITYNTKNYKENTIYLVITPKLIENIDLEVFNKLDNIYSNVDKLSTNMNTINKGAIDLANGANKLSSGSKEISNNLLKISNYMKQLEDGTKDLDNGLKEVINALNNASSELTNSNQEESINSLKQLQIGNNNAINKLTDTNNNIKLLFTSNNINIDTINIDLLPENLKTYKQTYDGNNNLIYLLNLNNEAINKTINTSIETNNTISNLITKLQDALTKLENGSNTIYTSTSTLSNGIKELYQGSLTLNNGIETLSTGANKLQSGISTYNKEGIQKLNSYTTNAKYITNKIEALIKLSNDYKGFASNNVNTSNFVSVIK